MKAEIQAAAPKWFLIAAIAAVLWNLLGVVAYLMDVTMNEEALAALPDAERALHASIPAWATGAYAIAVFAGLAGAILLASRRRFATPVFGLSLAGVAVQMLHAFVLSDSIAVLGWTVAIMPAIIFVVAIALLWFSFDARRRGWLN